MTQREMATSACVIKIGDRYFYGFGKGGRTLTAWSLAGAKLYSSAAFIDDISDDLRILKSNGKLPVLQKIIEATP